MMYKRIYILLIIIYLVPQIGLSQHWDWLRLISGTNNTVVFDIEHDFEGNVYVGGATKFSSTFEDPINPISPPPNGYSDIFVAKYSASGDLIWAKRTGGTLNDWGLDLAVDSLQNVYVTGYFRDTANFGGIIVKPPLGEIRNSFIAKYNKEGDIDWLIPGFSTNDSRGTAVSITKTNDILLGGWTIDETVFGTDTLGKEDFNSGYLICLDSDGRIKWSQQFENYGGVNDVTINNSNQTFVGGYLGKHTTAKNIYLASFDYEGNLLWELTDVSGQIDEIFGISHDNDNYLYAGGIFSFDVVIDSLSIMSDKISQGFISKFHNDGRVIFLKNVFEADSTFNFYDIEIKNNILIVTGRFMGNLAIDSTIYFSSRGSADGFIACFDTTGNVKWAEQFGSEPLTDCGGKCSDEIRAASFDHNNNLALGGFFKDELYFGDSLIIGGFGLTGFVSKFLLPIEPEIFLEKDSICLGDSTKFGFYANGSPLALSWVFENGSPSSSNISNPNVLFDGNGPFQVSLAVSNGYDNDTTFREVYLITIDTPEVFLPVDTLICENDTLEIHLDNIYSSYVWSDGSTLSTINIDSAGTFSILVSNEFGCLGYDEIIVVEEFCDNSSLINHLSEDYFIYPNPFRESLKILVPFDYSKFELFDAFGNRIKGDYTLFNGENNIDLNGLTKGIYFFLLMNDFGITHKGRIVKQ